MLALLLAACKTLIFSGQIAKSYISQLNALECAAICTYTLANSVRHSIDQQCRVQLLLMPLNHCLQLKSKRYLACARCKLWWMTPEWGKIVADLPPETQFLLVEVEEGGPYAVLLPLIDSNTFRGTLRPPRCASLSHAVFLLHAPEQQAYHATEASSSQARKVLK